MNLIIKKNKFYISLIVLILLFSTCRKEILVFDPKSNAKLELPLLLNFNNKSCFLDAKSKTLRFSLYTDSITNFSPLIHFQDYSEIKFNGIKLKNGEVNNLGEVKTNIPYPVIFETDGETNTFNLYFTNLPTVQVISLDKITTDPKSFAKIIVNYPNLIQKSTTSYIAIETRGGSTGFLEKKSYGFSPITNLNSYTKKPSSYFNFDSSSKWVLNAMFRDFSRIRNKVSFEIWNKVNRNPANQNIKTKLVELFLNHESLGIYNFHANYSQDFLGLNPSSVLIKGNKISSKTQFKEMDNETPTRYWNDWEQVFPKPSENLQWNDFMTFFELIVKGNNNQISTQVTNKLNIDNALDYILFMQIIQGGDNLGKNWFFTKLNSTNLFEILPWDMDAVFGRDHRGDKILTYRWVTNNLFTKLLNLNVNGFKDKLKIRWSELRLTHFSSANLKLLFKQSFDELRKSGVIDIENTVWKTTLNIDNEELYINNWIDNNLSFLDNKIISL